MRLVTFSEQAGASHVGLMHKKGIVDLCAAFERILVEQDLLPVPEAKEAEWITLGRSRYGDEDE